LLKCNISCFGFKQPANGGYSLVSPGDYRETGTTQQEGGGEDEIKNGRKFNKVYQLMVVME
jgi:hypothetical protein